MSHILVGFSTKKNDFLSRAICWVTRWKHSHVCLISPDRQWIAESTGIPFPDPLTGEYRTGCRVVPLAYLTSRDMMEVRMIPHPYPELVWQHAEKMAREKVDYDAKYSWGYFFRTGSEDPHKVSCNEYIELACKRAGQALYDMTMTSPRDLYLISKEI